MQEKPMSYHAHDHHASTRIRTNILGAVPADRRQPSNWFRCRIRGNRAHRVRRAITDAFCWTNSLPTRTVDRRLPTRSGIGVLHEETDPILSGFKCYIGMRYFKPSIKTTIEQAVSDGFEKIMFVPMWVLLIAM